MIVSDQVPTFRNLRIVPGVVILLFVLVRIGYSFAWKMQLYYAFQRCFIRALMGVHAKVVRRISVRDAAKAAPQYMEALRAKNLSP